MLHLVESEFCVREKRNEGLSKSSFHLPAVWMAMESMLLKRSHCTYHKLICMFKYRWLKHTKEFINLLESTAIIKTCPTELKMETQVCSLSWSLPHDLPNSTVEDLKAGNQLCVRDPRAVSLLCMSGSPFGGPTELNLWNRTSDESLRQSADQSWSFQSWLQIGFALVIDAIS